MLAVAVEPAVKPSVDQLLAELARIRAEGDRLRVDTTRRLVQLDAQAKELQAQIEDAALKEPVSDAHVPPPLALVPLPGIVPVVRKPASRQSHSDHEFPRKVGNIAAFVREHKDKGLTRARAKSWYAPADSEWARAIPRSWAKFLKKHYGVSLSCWHNGITDAEYAPRAKKE